MAELGDKSAQYVLRGGADSRIDRSSYLSTSTTTTTTRDQSLYEIVTAVESGSDKSMNCGRKKRLNWPSGPGHDMELQKEKHRTGIVGLGEMLRGLIEQICMYFATAEQTPGSIEAIN